MTSYAAKVRQFLVIQNSKKLKNTTCHGYKQIQVVRGFLCGISYSLLRINIRGRQMDQPQCPMRQQLYHNDAHSKINVAGTLFQQRNECRHLEHSGKS
jgi:hypothetical protein